MIGSLSAGTVDLLATGVIDPLRPTIVVLKTLILLSGGAITLYAFRAYRRTEAAALGALATGFGLVTLGALLAGAVDQVLPLSRSLALVVESAFTALGFAVILWSLFRR